MKTEKLISKQTNKTESKRGPRTVHIFDDVFRTMCEKMPKLLIPLINEAFGTSYDEDDELEQLRNERHLDGSMIITDALVKIREHLYHIECQSTDSDCMILRMFEYDTAIAIEHWREIPDGYEILFPRACVVYLRGEDKANRNKKLHVRFPNGEVYTYNVKVIEVQRYSRNELFKKKLLMFLPYYILRYERNLPLKRDKIRFQTIIKEYDDIMNSLEGVLHYDQEGYKRRLIELIDRISKYVTRKKLSLKKGLGDIMGGRVLKLETDKIIAESMAQGIMQEKNDTFERVTRNYMKLDPSLSREEAEEKAKAILS